MNCNKLARTTAAVLAMIGGIGYAQAQSTASPTVTQTQQPTSGSDARVKPSATTTAAPTVVTQTQQPSSGMDPKMKPSPKTTAVSPIITQTQQPGSGTSPMGATPSTGMSSMDKPMASDKSMSSTDKPMKKPAKEKRLKGETKPTAAGVGSGSAGTAEGRVEGSTNSNSKGEPAKKP